MKIKKLMPSKYAPRKYAPLHAALVLAIALAFALSACQSFGSAGALLQEPKVSFNSVDFADLTVNGLDLVAHIDVENPNLFSIPLPKVDWELFINEASFIKGEKTGGASVKSGGTTTLDIPLSLTYEGLLKTFTSLISTKEAAYNIALGLSFPIPVLGDKVYKLDFAGLLPLPQLPKLSGGSVGISQISHTGLTLAYTVNVENPNVFSIPVPDMDLDYGVNGVSVLKSVDKSTGNIAAGAVRPVNINMSLNYADIFKAVAAGADKVSGAGNAAGMSALSLRNATQAAGNLSLAALSPIPALTKAALSEVKSSLDIPGSIPIPQMPEISFQGITRKSLGTTMEFLLNFEVDNKNSFAYDIGEFLYNFKVNGASWARGKMNNPPEVKAKGKTVIPLSVSVSAVSIVRELVNILGSGSPVTYDCTGSMSLLGNLAGMEKLEVPLNLKGNSRIR